MHWPTSVGRTVVLLMATLSRHDDMLRDGTNPEGIDPVPKLGWNTTQDLVDVKVVSMSYSPPCAKIRYHLAFHKVPFLVITPAEFKKGKVDGDYTKVPAIFVGGRQVNDSYVIIKHLTPVLYGAAVDEEWEQKITYGLQLAMEVEGFEDSRNYATIVTFGGFPSFVGRFFWFVLPLGRLAKRIRAGRAEKNDRFGPLRAAKEYTDEFRSAVGEKPFFAGEQPGCVDVSFYATLVTWEPVPCVQDLLEGSDLLGWWQRMKGAMPALGP